MSSEQTFIICQMIFKGILVAGIVTSAVFKAFDGTAICTIALAVIILTENEKKK